tara:strand:- start:557 stop:2200 length:1644 start_codon:yes stop_codon:yes gene_type:complete
MGRYVGLSHNRGKGGGGGSGTIITTSAFDRSSGITTDGNNHVTKVTLGENEYEAIMYNSVGLITAYNEKIGDEIKGWSLTYDSNNIITDIVQAERFPAFGISINGGTTAIDEGQSVTYTVTTERIADGTVLYWDVSSAADFSTSSGQVTITGSTASFSVTAANDITTEGAETFFVSLYVDAARTNRVVQSANITINDTSIAPTIGGAIFHADAWNTQETYSWSVPNGITSISVVCVGGGGAGETNHDGAGAGGGGLAYKNNITVTGGETVTVVVGGGGFATSWGQTNPNNGSSSYITVGGTNYAVANGGQGAEGSSGNGWYSNSGSFPNTNSDGGGAGGSGIHYGGSRMSGGGAGGYNGGGDSGSGRAGNTPYWGVNPEPGQNGGGGGGHSANGGSSYYSNGGGGTGVYGQGTNGTAGATGGSPSNEYHWCGGGGSTAYNTGLRGYANQSNQSTYACGTDLGNGYDRQSQSNQHGQGGGTTPDGGFPGGGAGGANSGSPAGRGGNGMVRIIWGAVSGSARAFPSTNVDKSDQYGGDAETENGTQKMY